MAEKRLAFVGCGGVERADWTHALAVWGGVLRGATGETVAVERPRAGETGGVTGQTLSGGGVAVCACLADAGGVWSEEGLGKTGGALGGSGCAGEAGGVAEEGLAEVGGRVECLGGRTSAGTEGGEDEGSRTSGALGRGGTGALVTTGVAGCAVAGGCHIREVHALACRGLKCGGGSASETLGRERT